MKLESKYDELLATLIRLQVLSQSVSERLHLHAREQGHAGMYDGNYPCAAVHPDFDDAIRQAREAIASLEVEMDFNRTWTPFALEAEKQDFGFGRISTAHNDAIRAADAEIRRLKAALVDVRDEAEFSRQDRESLLALRVIKLTTGALTP